VFEQKPPLIASKPFDESKASFKNKWKRKQN
jgi:hypothetical protein